ncbi:hypothetical protein BDV12DRAFT_168135 [Aspergillus spectabilis]
MQGNDLSSSKPSSVACIPCRRRHLKCDALIPACTRCRTTITDCHYIQSRRGLWKMARNASTKSLNESDSSQSIEAFSDWLHATAFSSEASIDATQDIPLLPDDTLINFSELELITPDVAYDPMIQLYYQSFHHSHPIMIPRKALNTSLCYLIPSHIISIMRYVGAHYYPDPSLKETFRQAAFSCLSDPKLQAGFRVQALLLLAIADHSHCHEQNAHRLMETAIDLALEIGMHHASFARKHSYSHSVLAESWRRTYWELYVTDGLLSAMQEKSPFRLYHQRADVQLPCSEKLYTFDSVTQTEQTLEGFRANVALGQSFSTFAHRINAMQNLGAVLELNRSLETNIGSRLEVLDAQLTLSLMALPPIHADGYDSSCHDEMVFQAQMTLYLALIYLHHPRSGMQFASFDANHSTSCTRLQTTAGTEISPTRHLDLHSHKLLRAADMLSGLASLPSSIQYRSPFFTCALAICIIVHTATLLVVAGSGKEESTRARIQLSIGALKVLGKIWPLSKIVRQKMVDMYQAVVHNNQVV